jgi:hypothetical protein
VTSTTNDIGGGVAVTNKLIVGHVDNSEYPQITVDSQLVLTTPAAAAAPVPVIMAFSRTGARCSRRAFNPTTVRV